MMSEYGKKILTANLVAGISGALSFCLIFFLRPPYTLRNACDSSFMSFAIVLFLSLMSIIIRQGTFDVLNFSIYRFFESFRIDRKKRWEDAGAYHQDRMEKRHEHKPIFWIYFAYAGAWLLTSIILLVIDNASQA